MAGISKLDKSATHPILLAKLLHRVSAQVHEGHGLCEHHWLALDGAPAQQRAAPAGGELHAVSGCKHVHSLETYLGEKKRAQELKSPAVEPCLPEGTPTNT